MTFSARSSLGLFASTRLSLVLGAALHARRGAVHAQFKVIGADGKVTYTDREPSQPEGKVTALGAKAPIQAAEPDLPFELRQVASKYPVTLYTMTGACEPCVQARQYLKQRGVPFSERNATSNEDIEALEKISGGRETPTLTVGSQVLRGFGCRLVGPVPRRRRLPARFAPAVDLPVPCRDADHRAPRRRRRAHRRRAAEPRRCRAPPRPHRRHRRAGSASSTGRAGASAGGVVRETRACRRRCGAPPGCRCRPPLPSARTAPTRRASRRRARMRAASPRSTG